MRSPRRIQPTTLAVGLAYATNGFSMASWNARLPEIGSSVGTGTEGIAAFLLANALGTLVMVSLAGLLVERRGARWGYGLATIAFAAAYLVLAAATTLGVFAVLLLGGVVHGAAFALTNVPQGVLGAAAEARAGKTIVPRFHAFYSLAGAGGAALGGVAAVAGIPIGVQFLALAVIAAALRVAAQLLITVDAGHRQATASVADSAVPTITAGIRLPRSVWTTPAVLMLGGIVFAATLSESAANNWLAVAVVDGHGAQAAVGAGALSTFLIAQTAGRLLTGPLIDRVGRRVSVVSSTVLAVSGVLLVAVAPSVPAAMAAAAIWGLGAALAVPVSMSLAAAQPRAAASVAAVASVASLATVIGPPVIGLVAEAVDVRLAFAVIALALLASIPLTVQVFTRRTRAEDSAAPAPESEPPVSKVQAFMTEQPEALARASEAWPDSTVVALRALGARAERVVFIGSGTSSFAARAVEAFAATVLPGAEVRVLTPSEAVFALPASRFDDHTLVVAISQSARSVLVRNAVDLARSRGAMTVFVTGAAEHAPPVDVVLDISAGPEDVGAKTKGYSTTVVTLLRLAAVLAGTTIDGIGELPAATRTALDGGAGAIASFADAVDVADGLHIVGTQTHLATAQEAALKIVEIALVATSAYDVEEFTHGPHRRLSLDSSVVVVATADPMFDRAVSLEAWLRDIGVATLVLTDRPERFASSPAVVALTPLPRTLAPIPAIVPLQRLALALAARRGLSPDAVLYPEVDTLLARKDPS